MQDSNAGFDAVIEAGAAVLTARDDALDGLAEWLLDQRCSVKDPEPEISTFVNSHRKRQRTFLGRAPQHSPDWGLEW